ncbi:hypothetical protein BD408DRAFT_415024 [Parasitella parasitica]|nr:hypothetical protein BD408DRAFT_415024 [Parasitella parasitica]
MSFDRQPGEEQRNHSMFNSDMLWPSQHVHPDYNQTINMSLQADISSNNPPTTQSLATVIVPSSSTTVANTTTNSALSPAINTTNPASAPPPMLDPTKEYHPEWGVIKDNDFHPLTLKHQRDLEVQFMEKIAVSDFYFWQANLGGYCMADMMQGIVISSEGSFVLERKMVEGAPHPGRRKKKRTAGHN